VFGHRPDATLVRDLSPVRRFMPFLSPRRNDSLVYFSQDLDVTRALAFAEERSRARPPDRPVTLLHLLLRALTLVLTERPRLNRFTAGGRIWQRNGVWITLSAKQRFDDDAPILTVKQRFEPGETLDEMVDRLHAALRAGRSGKRSTADTEVSILLRLPAPLLHAAVRLVRLADGLGLLPARMIETDPMFASVFVANLGSVGLDAGYHHLWEYGSIPVFCVVGRIRPDGPGSRRVTLKWTYDERVEDGLYCARSLERLRELLENPEKL
jgi:hypothetical protein